MINESTDHCIHLIKPSQVVFFSLWWWSSANLETQGTMLNLQLIERISRPPP